MLKAVSFVNGSHLFTSFKQMELYVDDYEDLYSYIFAESVKWWKNSIMPGTSEPIQYLRTYWHVIDKMDEWDLASPKLKQYIFEKFKGDADVNSRWMAKKNSQKMTMADAFELFYDDVSHWYEKRKTLLSGMNRFHHAVESSTDFIEISACGKWKVDLLHKTVTEKGLDVCMAVNMVALSHIYDIAILIGADSDGISGLTHIKNMGKQMAVVEFVRGNREDYFEKGYKMLTLSFLSLSTTL